MGGTGVRAARLDIAPPVIYFSAEIFSAGANE